LHSYNLLYLRFYIEFRFTKGIILIYNLKLLLTYILTFPLLFFSQNKITDNINYLGDKGLLDSVQVKITFTHNQWNQIDSIKTFYITMDTITDENSGNYSIGISIKDPLMIYDKKQIGEWSQYYYNGQLKSIGSYKIGAFSWCQFAGPTINGYSYKYGEWKYFHKNGQLEAKGTYDIKTEEFSNNCGGDFAFYPLTTKKWQYWDKEGVELFITKKY